MYPIMTSFHRQASTVRLWFAPALRQLFALWLAVSTTLFIMPAGVAPLAPTTVQEFPAGPGPIRLVSDGASIWVLNY